MLSQENQLKNYAGAGIVFAFWGNTGYRVYPRSADAAGVLVKEQGAAGGFSVLFEFVTEGGDWPLIPDPTPRSGNDVLIGWKINPQILPQDASGFQRVYRVTGEYAYEQYTPLLPGKDTFYLGRLPIDDAQAIAIRLGTKYFDKAILGPVADSGLAGTQPSAAFNPINIIGTPAQRPAGG